MTNVVVCGVSPEKRKYNKMNKPIIYTSKWLRTTPKTAEVANAIFAALDHLNVEHRE